MSSHATSVTAGPLSFLPYDIGAGCSYVYGEATGDIFGTGETVIAFGDCYSHPRNDFRSGGAWICLWSARRGLERIFFEDASWHPNGPNHASAFLLPERAVLVDVNGNGLLDIVFVVNSHDAVVAYLNPGYDPVTGDPLGAWTRRILTTNAPGAVNLVLADPDGDGDQDIIVTTRAQNTVWPAARPGLGWLRNDGGGVWAAYADIQVNAGLDDLRTLAPLDIFVEGKDCIITTDKPGGTAQAWRRAANGTWTRYDMAGISAPGFFYGAVGLVDGKEQFLFAPNNGLWAADVMHTVTAPPLTRLAAFPTSWTVSEIAVGDLVGDGNPCIVFSVVNGGIYYLRKVSGAWQMHAVTEKPANYHSLRLVDTTGNGKLDVLVTVEYATSGSDASNIVRVFVNQ